MSFPKHGRPVDNKTMNAIFDGADQEHAHLISTLFSRTAWTHGMTDESVATACLMRISYTIAKMSNSAAEHAAMVVDIGEFIKHTADVMKKFED